MAKDNEQNQDPYFLPQKQRAEDIIIKYNQTVVELIVYTELGKIKRLLMTRLDDVNIKPVFSLVPKERFIILQVLQQNAPTTDFDKFLTGIEVYFKNSNNTNYDIVEKTQFRTVAQTIVFPST